MTSNISARVADVLDDARAGFASGAESSDGIFQVRMNNVTRDGGWDFTKKRYVPVSDKPMDRFLLRRGDVLFNATNSPELVGKTALVGDLGEPTVFSNHFLRLRTKPSRIDPGYLSRWLQREFERGVFEAACQRWVNQAAVKRDQLLAMKIPLPPLDEQRRIAQMLDAADALRGTRRRALAHLERLTHTVFAGLFRPDGDRSRGDRALGSAVSLVTKGTTPTSVGLSYADQGIPFLRAQNLVDGTVDLDERTLHIDAPTDAELRRSRIRGGDVLLSIAGTIGRSALVPANAQAMNCNQAVAIIRPDEDLSAEFLQSWLASSTAQRQIRAMTVTGTISNLSLSQIKSFRITVPPEQDQAAFATWKRSIDQAMGRMRAHLSHLDTLVASLQSRAFSGEL